MSVSSHKFPWNFSTFNLTYFKYTVRHQSGLDYELFHSFYNKSFYFQDLKMNL